MTEYLLLFLLLLSGCAVLADDGGSPDRAGSAEVAGTPELPGLPAAGSVLAIRGVSIVDPSTGSIADGMTVVVTGSRIASVGPADEVEIPGYAVEIDGAGVFAVPGLADMHVHLRREDLSSYLEHGVTTVRNLWGFPDLRTMMTEIETGVRDGPAVYAMSPGLDAAPQYWPYTQFVERPEDAPGVVRAQADAGWRTLKLYADLRRDAYDAIVDEARLLGMDFGGHVSRDVGIQHALSSGHRFIEHLSGYDMYLNPAGAAGAGAWRSVDESRMDHIIRRTVEAGSWNCPTLAIFAQLARGDERIVENRRAFVKQLYDAGAPLLAGTDSGIGRTMPGHSIHDELDEFVRSGIPDAEVLRIATVEAARFLEASDEFGRIAPGLRADILLIEQDPLRDISALRSPTVVIAGGNPVGPAGDE